MEFDDTVETTEDNFGQEVAASFACAVAAAAGTIVGMFAAGYAIEKIQQVRKDRKTKKNQTEEN